VFKCDFQNKTCPGAHNLLAPTAPRLSWGKLW
jgi:hypothetical protein